MENDKVCARVAIRGPFWNCDDKIVNVHYLCTVVTSAGQLWDARWTGVSITENDVRWMWRNQFDLFKLRAN